MLLMAVAIVTAAGKQQAQLVAEGMRVNLASLKTGISELMAATLMEQEKYYKEQQCTCCHNYTPG